MIYNLGTGEGYSVQQVIDIAREVTQCDIPVREGSRRPGDPAILVADPNNAMRELHWQPKYPELRMMIEHAWHGSKELYAVTEQAGETRGRTTLDH